MPKVPTQRRLEQMYVIGRPLTFDDGKGPVTVWLQKLNPIQLQQTLRRANAARARVRSVKSAPTSDEYDLIWCEVLDIGDHADLVRTLLAETIVSSGMRAEAQLASEEEWADEDYLQGLRDTWSDGMATAHLAEPTEESERVFAELKRFEVAVGESTKGEVDAARVELEALDLDELRRRAFDRQIRHLCGSAWMEELHRCELWLGVRTPCPACIDPGPATKLVEHVAHRERYFVERADVDELQGEPLHALLAAYADLSVDVIEGKGLGPTPDSESSSGSQPEAAMEPGSGPVDATA